MPSNYVTIQLPKEFVKSEIDPLIQDASRGFTSRADFVKQAIKAFNASTEDQK